MRAIELLKEQHREVEGIFERLQTAEGRERITLLVQLSEALTLHATLEERLIYPLMRQHGFEAAADKALGEHDKVKRLVAEILELKRSDPRITTHVARVKELVSAHVAQEESELFPQLTSSLDEETAQTLSTELERLIEDLKRRELLEIASHEGEAVTAPV